MLIYCKKCLYPNTKPDLSFNEEGICNACSNYSQRSEVNWEVRKTEFLDIVNRYKNESNYDCIVPVSGGKDSTFQVITLLKNGLKPLCVTASTDSLSDIGKRNIANLKNLGVDYIEFTYNPHIRRKLNKFCLENIGDISWPEHVTIFTLPVRMAVALKIPLIVWGENPQNEYGGPAASTQSKILNRRWLEEFGGLLGLRVSDLSDSMGISPKDLISYNFPEQAELDKAEVTGLFLGYFVPWDGFTNAIVSQSYGFETYPNNIEGSLTNYENLDNYQVGIHDYFKFLKYGFGRATDLACNHIRRERLQRDQALDLVTLHDGKFPWTYLGRDIKDILAEIDMSIDQFITICDRFTNKKLFLCDKNGNLIKDSKLNLTKVNYDNL
jgi:N-acetyl sugar amidotransferase